MEDLRGRSTESIDVANLQTPLRPGHGFSSRSMKVLVVISFPK